jgi:hypothetical protein
MKNTVCVNSNDATWGTVNIESSKVPQKNVEGLEESLQTLATSIVNTRDEFRAFKKHAEHDIEQNTKNIKMNTDDLIKDGLIYKSKTPRTDKAEPQIRFIKSGWVRSDFARELELELNDLKKELDNSKFGAQCSVHELEYDKKTLIKENLELWSRFDKEMEAEKHVEKLMKALKSLICTAQKDEINKDHLDKALRRARNVIADIDPTIEKCDCCY